MAATDVKVLLEDHNKESYGKKDVLFSVDRYRGEDIHYSWSCFWAEIK